MKYVSASQIEPLTTSMLTLNSNRLHRHKSGETRAQPALIDVNAEGKTSAAAAAH